MTVCSDDIVGSSAGSGPVDRANAKREKNTERFQTACGKPSIYIYIFRLVTRKRSHTLLEYDNNTRVQTCFPLAVSFSPATLKIVTSSPTSRNHLHYPYNVYIYIYVKCVFRIKFQGKGLQGL